MGRFRVTDFGGGWYHNAPDSYETVIKRFDKKPCLTSFWVGPFRTWGEARKDALNYHRSKRADATYAMSLLRWSKAKREE